MKVILHINRSGIITLPSPIVKKAGKGAPHFLSVKIETQNSHEGLQRVSIFFCSNGIATDLENVKKSVTDFVLHVDTRVTEFLEMIVTAG